MDKYECGVCGYIYDPEAGDPKHAVNTGTAFEDLPEEWVCPVCHSLQKIFNLHKDIS